MTELGECLAELTDWFQVHQPARLAALRPGLSRKEIDDLSACLLPYRLPEDICQLYEWRDGEEEGISGIFPWPRWLPLGEGCDLSENYQDLGLFWNPLWCPLRETGGDKLFVVCDTERVLSSPIFNSPHQDPDLYLLHRDIAAMMRTILDCHRERYYVDEEGWLEDVGEDDVRRRHSPSAYPFVDQIGRTRISRVSRRDWPDAWKQAVGLSEQDFLPTGRTHSVEEFRRGATAGANRVVFHGQVIRLTGSRVGHVIRLADGTGDVLIQCPASLVGDRELRISDYFEVEVVEGHRADLEFLERHYGRQADLLATRIVFLRVGER